MKEQTQAMLDGTNKGTETATGDDAGERVFVGSRTFPGMYLDGEGRVVIPTGEANGARLATRSWSVQRKAVERELNLALFRIELCKFRVRFGLVRFELRKKLRLFRIRATKAVLQCLLRLTEKGGNALATTHVVTPNVEVHPRAEAGEACCSTSDATTG